MGIGISIHNGIYIIKLMILSRELKGLNGTAFKISPKPASGKIVGANRAPCFFCIFQQIDFAVIGSRKAF